MRGWIVSIVVLVASCKKGDCPPAPAQTPSPVAAPTPAAPSTYLDNAGRDDALGGGSRMIPIKTAAGTFNVWVKRTGNNPRIKVLLLHGGPGATHEYLQAFDSFFPKAEVE